MAMGGNTTVGKISYIVDVNTDDLDKGLDRAEKKVNSSGGKVGGGFAAIGKAAAVGLAAAGTAVAGLATAAVKGYADYEQLAGGVETLFKQSSDMVLEYANNAYKTAGLSANQYMDTVTSFSASLLQGLGGNTEAAAKYADMAVTDMADNANKMGTSMSMIQDAYQGFAKDNYTMLDNLKLGYGGTQSEMARLINDSGVMGDSFKATAENVKDIPFDKLIEGIHKTQERMGITGTTAKEASETISGSFTTMKSAWDNLVAGISNEDLDFDKLIDDFVKSIGTFGKNVIPTFRKALGGIVMLVEELAPLLIEQIPILFNELFPSILSAAVQLTLQLVAMLPQLIQTIFNALVQVLPTLIQALVQLLPQILIAVANLVLTIVQELTKPETLTLLLNGAIQLFLAIVQAWPQIMEALVQVMPTLINNLVTFLTDPTNIKMLIKASIQLFLALVKAVPQIIGALFGAFGNLIGNLWNRLAGLFSSFAGNFGRAVGQVFKNAINGVLGFIEGFINGPIDLINGAIGAINKIPGVNIGRLGRVHIPRMYTGGIVEPGGRIIRAGDGGEDEWVVPESKMASLVDKIGGSAGQNITINISGVFATSPAEQRKVAQQIADQLEIINRSRMGAGGVI